jgi:hemolysin III
MGWAVIFTIKPLYYSLGQTGLLLLIIGGVSYTIGAILYAIGSKLKFMHSVFHFFVVGGSVLHFFSIFLYVI